MTVNSTVNRTEYAGNGVTTAFATGFPFLAAADLVVLLVDNTTGVSTTQVLTTNYTVSGGSGAAGTVTMLVAPATGTTLVIYRDPALTQLVDLVPNDPLPVDTGVEQPLDKLTMIAQRDRDLIGRSLRIPDGDFGFSSDDMKLPAAVDRATKILGFDAAGKPIATAVTDVGVPVSSFMETVLDDPTASAARTTLGAMGAADLTPYALIANLSSGDLDSTYPAPKLKTLSPSPAGTLHNPASITVDANGRVTATVARWIGFYNGQAGSGYSIGRCFGSDGFYFSKDRENHSAFIDPAELSGTGFTYTNVLAPCPVIVGSLIYLYYEGFESGGSTYNIRMMILDLDGRFVDGVIPPILVPGGGGFMNHSVRRPCVMYEPSDSTWPFKMLFGAGSSSINPNGIGYARSADGKTWTVVGQALAVGAGGTWDDTGLEPHTFRNRSGTYEMVYGGAADVPSDPGNWQVGVATASDPAGTWTKYGSNPIIPHRTSAETTLTANTAVRDRQVAVTSTAQFLAGDIVELWDASGAASNELHVIKTVDDATHATFYEPIAGAYTTANTAKITAIDKNSVDPAFMWYDTANNRLVMHATGFQHINGRLREYDMIYTVTGNNPATTSWVRFPHTRLPLAPSQKSTCFDKDSAENLFAVQVS